MIPMHLHCMLQYQTVPRTGRRPGADQPVPTPPPTRQLTMMTWDTRAGMVLSLGGELDIATTTDLLAKVRALIDEGHLRIVADLWHLEFCDVSGLRALLRAQRLTADVGGWTRLARTRPSTVRIIGLAGLGGQLGGYPSAAAAFAQGVNRAASAKGDSSAKRR